MDQNESLEKERQFCLRRLKELEPAYLALRQTLTDEQQMLLADHIAACEALTEAELQLRLR